MNKVKLDTGYITGVTVNQAGRLRLLTGPSTAESRGYAIEFHPAGIIARTYIRQQLSRGGYSRYGRS